MDLTVTEAIVEQIIAYVRRIVQIMIQATFGTNTL